MIPNTAVPGDVSTDENPNLPAEVILDITETYATLRPETAESAHVNPPHPGGSPESM